ncbi:sericin-2-like [Macrobrachium rosenbergii]|uniref:sericin-2-like n=1 Tax=Macrobrachium rosenbergii TaxID=79674 RepID=UPI0034D55FB5
MKFLTHFWFLPPFLLLLISSGGTEAKRQGSLLQPISGEAPSPPPETPSMNPSRGSGSGQSLLQPFTGNVYNSHSNINTENSPSSISHGVLNTDHTIQFQGSSNTGSTRPRATRRPPGSLPGSLPAVAPADSESSLNSGGSSLPGYTSSFGATSGSSISSSQGVSQSGRPPTGNGLTGNGLTGNGLTGNGLTGSSPSFSSSSGSSSFSSSSSGSSPSFSSSSSSFSQSAPGSSSSSSSSFPSSSSNLGSSSSSQSTPNIPKGNSNKDVNLQLGGFAGFGSSSSKQESSPSALGTGGKDVSNKNPTRNNSQTVVLSSILMWIAVMPPLMTLLVAQMMDTIGYTL